MPSDPSPVSSAAAEQPPRRPALLRQLAPGAALMALGVVVFLLLLDAVQERDDLASLDGPVLTWLVDRRGPVVTGVFQVVTLVSGPTVLPVVVVVACTVWALARREWWRPVLLSGAMAASTTASVLLKGAVGRARPPLETMDVPGAETTASFPSGHTLAAATLLLVAAYLSCSRHTGRRRVVVWSLVAAVLIGLVALSRLYLGYHFLTDVLASVALAVAVVGGVCVVDRAWAPATDLRPGRSPRRSA